MNPDESRSVAESLSPAAQLRRRQQRTAYVLNALAHGGAFGMNRFLRINVLYELKSHMKHFWVFCESFCDRKRDGISLHLFPSW